MATRKRSIVWSFFKEEDDKKVLCLICARIIHHFGKTTNMLRHLRSEHHGEFSDFNFESNVIVTGLTAKTTMRTNKSVNLSNGLVEVAVMLEDPEKASQESGIEDMEMHAIEGILHAAADQLPTRDQNADGAAVATPSRKRSAVWMHYQKTDDEKKALCLLCSENIQHQSTSNLLRHLQKKHPSHFSQLEMHSLQRTGRHTTCHTRPNHQLNAEAVTPADPERSPPESGIEDMEVHAAVEDMLHDAAVEGPCSDKSGEIGDVEGIPVATPSRKSSTVWRHYRKLDDENAALCLLCKKKIKYQSSTSNLRRHLEKKHPSHFTQTAGLKRRTDGPILAVNSPDHQLNRAVEQLPQPPSHYNNCTLCTGWSEGRVLQRERELTEALRRVQREEGRCLEQQRELLEKSRELQAEMSALHTERSAVQEEAKTLQREKEEIQAERTNLQNERQEVERLKQELKEERAMMLGQRPEVNLMCNL